MKQLLILIFLMCAVNLSAQVTIGKLAEPHKAAILDLSQVPSKKLGLLLPPVELRQLDDFYPLVGNDEDISNAKGMVVYNTKIDFVEKLHPGIHVWDGEKWGRIGCLPATIIGHTPANKTTSNKAGFPVTLGISVADSPDLTYQWYKALTANNTGGQLITDATGASCSVVVEDDASYYYYCVVSSSCNASTDTSDVFTVNIIDPATLYPSSGTLSGRTTFDVAKAVEDSCGTFAIRRAAVGAYADFALESTYKQTYTFTPDGPVSNVRFAYVEPETGIVTSLTPDDNYSGDISTACTATLTYADVNDKASGTTRSEALKVDIYAIYESSGQDCAETLTAWIQDCACSGAYTTTGAWLVFMPYNLGANPAYATPEAQMDYPSVHAYDPSDSSTDSTVYGAIYQWGRSRDGHQIRKYQTDQTNTQSSATAPGHDKFIYIYENWYDYTKDTDATTATRDSLWTDASKTDNDPCPIGYKVPTMAQWQSIFNGVTTTTSNADTAVSGHGNNWSWKSTTATKGAYRDGTLFLPAAGNRAFSTGKLNNAGLNASYWSSTVDNTNSTEAYSRSYYLSYRLPLNSSSSEMKLAPYYRANGFSVRCVAVAD